jgi:prevent-host-death family protein
MMTITRGTDSVERGATHQRPGEPLVYTMRDLNQYTSRVLDEINKAKQPALITRRGRPVALITPLMNSGFESRAISLALQNWQESSTS